MIERIVLFGASGDLAARLLLPAVAELAQAEQLPTGLQIVGSATAEWSTDDFRQHVRTSLDEHATEVAPIARDAVTKMLTYTKADVTSSADVQAVLGGGDRPDTLVYLALPSGLLTSVLPALAGCGLTAADAVAVEKPFGTDLASAQHLNEILHTQMPQPTVFRVDHFLSNDLVHQVLALRFLNRVFEPTWNAVHVDRIDISWMEDLTLEGRASYYDRAGAMKDMVQNHLMEVMSLVLMEQPSRMDAASFRGTRVEALRSVATPDAAAVGRSVRARYTAGTIGDRQVPDYVAEPGVDASRATETYASVTLEADNARWAGVPITLRSGKSMPANQAEVCVHFKPLPGYLVDQWQGVQPNVLRLGLMEPYVRLGTTLADSGRSAEARELELSSATSGRTPYANLILEMLRNDPRLFIRSDEAEEAWRIVDPIAEAWAAGTVPLQEYAAGTPPPGPAAGG